LRKTKQIPTSGAGQEPIQDCEKVGQVHVHGVA